MILEPDRFCCALQANDESRFWCASNHIGINSELWLATFSMYKTYTVIHDIAIYIRMNLKSTSKSFQCIRIYAIYLYTYMADFTFIHDIGLYLL